jgi:hypothetical protein
MLSIIAYITFVGIIWDASGAVLEKVIILTMYVKEHAGDMLLQNII